MVIIFFILIAVFIFYTFSFNTVSDQEGDYDIVMDMKRSIQPYSGLNEDIFIQYINNLDMFQKNIEFVDIASKYFYNALENLYDLQLDGPEFEFTGEISDIAVTGEEMLLRSSLKHGTMFNPKYLNK